MDDLACDPGRLTTGQKRHEPGYVLRLSDPPGWESGRELERELSARFPAGRVGEPEDVARLVAFLAGSEAAWITGQIIHSEGGFLRR